MNRLTSIENPTTLRTPAKMARERLQASCYKVLSRISCECQDGVLVLYGRVFSFREKKIAEAREQFDLERRTVSACGLTQLGVAMTLVSEGHPEAALNGLTLIASADPDFLWLNLPQFRDAISDSQAKQMIEMVRSRQAAGTLKPEIAKSIEKAFLSEDAPVALSFSEEERPSATEPTPAMARRFFIEGQYAKCSHALEATLRTLGSDQLQLLAACSYDSGDYRAASTAAQRLKSTSTTRAGGLYWESKADQKLAIAALTRAGGYRCRKGGELRPRAQHLIGPVTKRPVEINGSG